MVRLLPALLLALAASPAQGHVYLNGVLIDGVTGQDFTHVQRVTIDDKGDIHIDAPDYEIEKQEVGTGATAAATPALAHRYWLVTTSPAEGVTVEVWAGVTLIRRIAAGEGPVAEEVTSFLRPGPNHLRVTVRKEGTTARSLPVVIGEASVSDGGEVSLSGDRVSFDAAPGREGEQTLTAR